MNQNLEIFRQTGNCPVRSVLDRVGDKWSLLILLILGEGTLRFNQLQATIGEISQKMLSASLKHLEADGLVTRTQYPEIPPKVEYALTPLGHSLLPHLRQLTHWAKENMEAVLQARTDYAQREAGTPKQR